MLGSIEDGRRRGTGVVELYVVTVPDTWPVPDQVQPTAADCGIPAEGQPHPHDTGLQLLRCGRAYRPGLPHTVLFDLWWG